MPGHGEAPPWVVQQLVGTHSPSMGFATAQAALQLPQKEYISNVLIHTAVIPLETHSSCRPKGRTGLGSQTKPPLII